MKKYNYVINGVAYEVTISEESDSSAKVEVNGELYMVEKSNAAQSTPAARPRTVTSQPVVQQNIAPTPSQPARVATPAKGAGINSPLPGVIMKILVKQGEEVKKGQTLIILEAMKMENNVDADRDGHVVAIHCSEGGSVMEGDLLVEIGD
jgi:methylmalonyl-coA decarboxylase, gamma subunit